MGSGQESRKNGHDGTIDDRRLVPERGMPVQQKCDSQRQSRIARRSQNWSECYDGAGWSGYAGVARRKRSMVERLVAMQVSKPAAPSS